MAELKLSKDLDDYINKLIKVQVDEVKENFKKSAIMVFINNSVTITSNLAWGQYHLPFNAIYKNIGSAFTLIDTTTGAVKYNGNRNAIRITMQIFRDGSTTAGTIYPTISTLNQYYENRTDANTPFSTINVIQTVSKGDVIYPFVRPSGTGNIVLLGNPTSPYTYMIIEEI